MIVCGGLALLALGAALYFYTRDVSKLPSKKQQDDAKTKNLMNAAAALLVFAFCVLYAYNASHNLTKVALPAPTTSLLQSPGSL